MNSECLISPFLKWPGGKRWFVHNYSHLLPRSYNRYIEPFLGSGAVFFHLRPKIALLGDTNPDVISAFEGLKTNWKSVKKSLQYHHRNHSKDYYYEVRDNQKIKLVPQASRIIYLNRTCFNGIYRVNFEGKFNVPIGTRTNVLLETDNFKSVSDILQNATLRTIDFEELIDEAKANDLIFADPPYTVRHNLNGFVRYNEQLFSWNDQERLANALIRAKKRGAKIVLTNANHFSVKELYANMGFYFLDVSRQSSIAASPVNRKQFEELVILTHPNN